LQTGPATDFSRPQHVITICSSTRQKYVQGEVKKKKKKKKTLNFIHIVVYQACECPLQCNTKRVHTSITVKLNPE